jgi:hypothetical protein
MLLEVGVAAPATVLPVHPALAANATETVFPCRNQGRHGALAARTPPVFVARMAAVVSADRPAVAITAGDFLAAGRPHLLARHVPAVAAQENVASLAAPASPNVTTPAGRIGTPPGNVPGIFIAHDGPPSATIQLRNAYCATVPTHWWHSPPRSGSAPVPPSLVLPGVAKRGGAAERGGPIKKSRECCPTTTIPASAYARTVRSPITANLAHMF